MAILYWIEWSGKVIHKLRFELHTKQNNDNKPINQKKKKRPHQNQMTSSSHVKSRKIEF